MIMSLKRTASSLRPTGGSGLDFGVEDYFNLRKSSRICYGTSRLTYRMQIHVPLSEQSVRHCIRQS